MAEKFSELRARISPAAKEHSDQAFRRMVEELRTAADPGGLAITRQNGSRKPSYLPLPRGAKGS
jgi:hypothetical protein